MAVMHHGSCVATVACVAVVSTQHTIETVPPVLGTLVLGPASSQERGAVESLMPSGELGVTLLPNNLSMLAKPMVHVETISL